MLKVIKLVSEIEQRLAIPLGIYEYTELKYVQKVIFKYLNQRNSFNL